MNLFLPSATDTSGLKPWAHYHRIINIYINDIKIRKGNRIKIKIINNKAITEYITDRNKIK